MIDLPSLVERLTRHGQQHVLQFWDALSDASRERLAAQIESLDLTQLDQLIASTEQPQDWAGMAERAVSPPAIRPGHAENAFGVAEATEAGEAALRAGQVAALLVAGGQGSRLGFEHPKGMFPLGPVSNRTLFQILFDRLNAVQRRYAVTIPLYLMTSPATHAETLQYLEQNQHCGLRADQVHVFCQGTMPAVDAESGKLLLCARDSLCLSPDGHGGMLGALAGQGCLEQMAAQETEHLVYFQVDNPMVQVCDPEFLGYHLLSKSEMSTQVVAKQDPEERVGVVVSVDGVVRIIEYSDLPSAAAARCDEDGGLALWAGSTAMHVVDRAFLDRIHQTAPLPFHQAHKQVAYLDGNGELVEPQKPNATKFERFIFDLLPEARNAIVMEVRPEDAFSPVKNADGAPRDTPATAKATMVNQHRAWLQQAGATVRPDVLVEINPLLALDANEVKQKLANVTSVNSDTYWDGTR